MMLEIFDLVFDNETFYILDRDGLEMAQYLSSLLSSCSRQASLLSEMLLNIKKSSRNLKSHPLGYNNCKLRTDAYPNL